MYRYSLCPFKRGIESISFIILNRQFIVTKTQPVKYVASNVHRAHPSAVGKCYSFSMFKYMNWFLKLFHQSDYWVCGQYDCISNSHLNNWIVFNCYAYQFLWLGINIKIIMYILRRIYRFTYIVQIMNI